MATDAGVVDKVINYSLYRPVYIIMLISSIGLIFLKLLMILE